VALLHTVGARSWTRDGLHKELQGYTNSRDELVEASLVAPDPKDKDKLNTVPPVARFEAVGATLGRDLHSPLIDKLHRALAELQAGRDLSPWLLRWAGHWEELREGLRFLGKKDAALRELCLMAVRTIEQAGPEPSPDKGKQMGLFGNQKSGG